MNQLGIWQIEGNSTSRISLVPLTFEKELEDLIENDPSLIESGLKIVGRQLNISNGRVDLLGINTQGLFTIIEIKKGSLFRETVAQALDYASEISRLSFGELKKMIESYLLSKKSSETLKNIVDQFDMDEEDENDSREVVIKIIGVGKIDAVERMIDFLTSKSALSIEVIGFQLFQLDGKRILIRELSETTRPKISLDTIQSLSRSFGTNNFIDKTIEFGHKYNLNLRPFKTSLMVAPKQNGNRCLFTVWVEPNTKKELKIYVAAEAFEQFMPIAQEDFATKVCKKGWELMNYNDFKNFIQNLTSLLSSNSQVES